MKYFFYLGRNPYLSYAEIISYLKNNSVDFKKIYFKENLLVLDLKEGFIPNIRDLGGTIYIGSIKFEGQNDEFNKFLNDWFIDEDKFSYSFIGNYQDKIKETLSLKFKREKVKAIFKGNSKKIKLQTGEFVALPISEKVYFYLKLKETIHFGKVEQEFPKEEIEFRDMKKPFRREELAISPRLAKILINLSRDNGNILLDPFCGIGVILQEGLLDNLEVIGVDIDDKAISQCKSNIQWLKENYKIEKDFRLIRDDSKKVQNLNFDFIATEPNLGELTKRNLDEHGAKIFLSKFENFIIPILINLRRQKKKNSKIAIIFPRTRFFSVDINNILERTGLYLAKLEDIHFPIREYRPDSHIEREIYLLC